MKLITQGYGGTVARVVLQGYSSLQLTPVVRPLSATRSEVGLSASRSYGDPTASRSIDGVSATREVL